MKKDIANITLVMLAVVVCYIVSYFIIKGSLCIVDLLEKEDNPIKMTVVRIPIERNQEDDGLQDSDMETE